MDAQTILAALANIVYPQGYSGGMFGMGSAADQMAEAQARKDALRAQGASLDEIIASQADNPMLFALGTGNVGSSRQALAMDQASRMARAEAMGFNVDAYHGTNQPISTFDIGRRGSATSAPSAEKAFWFTDDPSVASSYAQNAGKTVKSDVVAFERRAAQLKMAADKAEKIAQRTQRQTDWDAAYRAAQRWEDFEISAMRAPDEIGQNVMPVRLRMANPLEIDAAGSGLPLIRPDGSIVGLTDLVNEAMRMGRDSLVVRAIKDMPGGEQVPATHYAVFSPEQIRSRFAAFDPAKKDSADLLAGLAPFLALLGIGAASEAAAQ